MKEAASSSMAEPLCEHCVQPGEWDGYGVEPVVPVLATQVVRQPATQTIFGEWPECDEHVCDYHAGATLRALEP